MPIRPELRPLYPSNWREISSKIRFDRARGKCEFCGAPHSKFTRSDIPDTFYDSYDEAAFSVSDPHENDAKISRIILTTAHLDHDPTNNADENLRALCQKCHLAHDLPHHLLSRRINRERETRQGRLFPREEPHEIA